MELKSAQKPRIAWTLFWFAGVCLCGFVLAQGGWALSQPWGALGGKVFAMAFFSILLLYCLYQFLHAFKPDSNPLTTFLSLNVISALCCFAFVAGGIYLLVNGHPSEQTWGLVGIFFFGLCGFVFLRRAYLKPPRVGAGSFVE